MNQRIDESNRAVLATRIHDRVLHELGQDVDVNLLLGPPDYARAVLSLCRACGSRALADLAAQFERLSEAEAHGERAAQQQRLGGVARQLVQAQVDRPRHGEMSRRVA
ncbi:MAG: hypothetical protein IPG93_09755 [Burkholderiales bacterium]|nr:hypothetical protein [Burkholderiales bacterium]